VVGQENQPLPSFRIHVANAPKPLRILFLSLRRAQADDLVASQAGRFVHGTGGDNVEAGVSLASDDEVRVGFPDPEKAVEIEVASVENIDASRFVKDTVEEVHVVLQSLGNPHEHRDWACQVYLRVQLDGGLACAKSRPWKHGKAEIDGGRVHGVDHLLEIQPIGVGGVKPPRFANQYLGERLVDSPVPILVGVGQVGARNVSSDTHSIEMRASSKAGFKVAQAFPKGDLSKCHGEELIAGGHAFAQPGHRVQGHAALELFAINQFGDLGENQTSGVHLLLRMTSGKNSQPVQMRDMLSFS